MTTNTYIIGDVVSPMSPLSFGTNTTVIPLLNMDVNAVGGQGRNCSTVYINEMQIGVRAKPSAPAQEFAQVFCALMLVDNFPPGSTTPTLESVFYCDSRVIPGNNTKQCNPFGFLNADVQFTYLLSTFILNTTEAPTATMNLPMPLEVTYPQNTPSGTPPQKNNLFLVIYDTNVFSDVVNTPSKALVEYLVKMKWSSGENLGAN